MMEDRGQQQPNTQDAPQQPQQPSHALPQQPSQSQQPSPALPQSQQPSPALPQSQSQQPQQPSQSQPQPPALPQSQSQSQTYYPPAYGSPVYRQPAYGQPAYGQPAYGSPTQFAPAPPPQILTPAVAYKKALRRDVMKIAVALILFYAINISVVLVIMVGHLVVGSITQAMVEAAHNIPSTFPQADVAEVLDDFPYGVASIAGIIAGSLALLIVRGKRLFTTDVTQVNERMKLADFLKMFGLVLGCQAIISLVAVLLTLLAGLSGVSLDNSSDSMFDPYMNFPGVLYVVILGPIFEEIIFRGAIMRALQPYGKNFAIVISSLLFGAYHLVFFQSIFAFFVGLVLAYCAMRFSLKWSILLHMLNNALATLTDFVFLYPIIELGLYLLLFAAAILAAVLAFQQFRQQLRTGKPQSMPFALGAPLPDGYHLSSLQRPKPFAITFSSAWTITLLAIAFIIMIVPLFSPF